MCIKSYKRKLWKLERNTKDYQWKFYEQRNRGLFKEKCISFEHNLRNEIKRKLMTMDNLFKYQLFFLRIKPNQNMSTDSLDLNRWTHYSVRDNFDVNLSNKLF